MSNNLMKDLGKRLFVSTISISIIFVLLYFSQNIYFKPIFFLVLMSLSLFAVYEYILMLNNKNIFLRKKVVYFCSFLQMLSLYIFSQVNGMEALPLIIFTSVFFILFISSFTQIKGSISSIGLSVFSILYIVVPIGLLFKILYFNGSEGIFWLVFLIAVTKISDVGAYFGGKLFGRHKLASKISPNKTIEGAIIGVICSIALSYFFYFLYINHMNMNLPVTTFLVLGIVLAIFGMLGDLAESVIKRDANVKDSNKLPGVGGILDMLDSLLFTIPLMFIFLEVIVK